jgi:(p)ppGpp synthase/HD superfamily hydrolase
MKDFRLALRLADTLAEYTLRDARDKSDVPLIEHVRRVYRLVESRGGTHEQQIAALLHDSIEEGTIDYASIRRIFSAEIADTVDALTRRGTLSYDRYVESLRDNRSALIVKLCDLDDNLDPDRYRSAMTEQQRASLETRYRKARVMIRDMLKDSAPLL